MKSMILVLVLSISNLAFSSNKPLETVPSVDLGKYSGTWYEIASMPQSFQKKCLGNTTAEYSLAEKNRVKVLNSCDTEKGRDSAEGRAKVINKETNAQLKVTFVKLGAWIFTFGGDYHVIGLAEDYRYAVVGHPSRKYGWVLSRTPQMTEADISEVKSILTAADYDLCTFKITPQGSTSPVESRPTLCN